MRSSLSLGVEEELHVIDLSTFRLTGRAPALLARLPTEHFTSELQRTTVEIKSEVVASLDDLHVEIVRLREQVTKVAATEGLGLACVGTVPLSDAGDFALTSSGRFARMQEDYRLLVDEQLICGTQVHVGVADADVAVDVAQRVGRDLPVLLALSASSPLWHGADTGYASFRSIIWQRWPTSGTPGPLASAAEYHELLDDLIASGVIKDTKMAYFDVRPSSHVPTIELRTCDACPVVDDIVLVAGMFRAMVAAAESAGDAGERIRPLSPALHRAAMWRAARSGLSGDLIDPVASRVRPVPATQAVKALVSRLRPQLEKLGDWDMVTDLVEAIVTRGNSADRQRRAFAERGRLADVVSQVVAETAGAVPEIPEVHARGADYPIMPGDEAFTPAGSLRPSYRKVFETVESIGADVLTERLDERDRWASGSGMTFGGDAAQEPFSVDVIPRVIPAFEWQRLVLGLAQRARVLEMFLGDVYADGEVVRDGVLPAAAVYDCPGWRDEGRHLPRGVVRAPILGFDLVRDDSGGWHVLEDNARVPSGVGYAIAIRQLMDAVMPEVPRPVGLLPSHTAPGLLRQTLRACTPVSDPVIALLSDGMSNSAWFEHRLLAERAGFLLAQPADVAVRGGVVTVGDERVDVLYLRLDVELVDLTAPSGPIGLELMGAATNGAVTLANAPGNGVADDKAMYCNLPDLIAYYLGERPLLDPVPTYRCGDPDECRAALDRLAELVTKPVDGHGGKAILVGPHASQAELEDRRRQIVADPRRWVAQEVVNLSTHPTLTPSGLEPRRVDLRAFVYLSGTTPEDVRVVDLALTRVAPTGSMVVNSSRGGGAKDTWILGPLPDED